MIHLSFRKREIEPLIKSKYNRKLFNYVMFGLGLILYATGFQLFDLTGCEGNSTLDYCLADSFFVYIMLSFVINDQAESRIFDNDRIIKYDWVVGWILLLTIVLLITNVFVGCFQASVTMRIGLIMVTSINVLLSLSISSLIDNTFDESRNQVSLNLQSIGGQRMIHIKGSVDSEDMLAIVPVYEKLRKISKFLTFRVYLEILIILTYYVSIDILKEQAKNDWSFTLIMSVSIIINQINSIVKIGDFNKEIDKIEYNHPIKTNLRVKIGSVSIYNEAIITSIISFGYLIYDIMIRRFRNLNN